MPLADGKQNLLDVGERAFEPVHFRLRRLPLGQLLALLGLRGFLVVARPRLKLLELLLDDQLLIRRGPRLVLEQMLLLRLGGRVFDVPSKTTRTTIYNQMPGENLLILR